MNKTAIKKFAVESRQKLIKSTIERLEELGITDKEVVELVKLGGVYSVKAQTLTETEKKNRDTIISKIQEKGYEPFVEEVAYTWFNRIIAIRYMEVNDYLPFRIRVLSSEIQGKVDPDIITEIVDCIEELELNRDKVIELKEQNKQEELFKYVFIKVCNYCGQFLPIMFETIEDYTELLLPSVMISNGSVIKDMIELVPEEDWTNQVEIIGWLYQYYISEKKDQVFADLKKNKKITKENIPAATQLFTPEWIVKYMVENSLGRLWLEGHPNEDLKSKWKYYLEEAEQEEAVEIELAKLKKESEILTPEDLTIIDPAMGSGHILVYAFDVLYQIYQSEGYSEKEIPRLILEKNIYGLDIDDRAGQLAYFALMMKARGYSRRFFKDIQKKTIELNVVSITESNKLLTYDISSFIKDKNLVKEIEKIISIFENAKEYGSILEVENHDFNILIKQLTELLCGDINLFDKKYSEIYEITHCLLKQANILAREYDVCITNPPYMGLKGMNNLLSQFAKRYYNNSKNDLCIMFIERCSLFTKKLGYTSLITMHSWMFLSSFEQFRKDLIANNSIESLVHLGARAFEEIGGEVVQTVTWVMRKDSPYTFGKYIRLVDYKVAKLKEENFFDKENTYHYDKNNFYKIPSSPITYWMSKRMYKIFEKGIRLGDIASPRKGNSTSDNNRFLRLWTEVELNKINFEQSYINKERTVLRRWYPYNKGGGYRKWYGNNEYLIDWKNDGEEIRNIPTAVIANYQYFMKPGLTWSTVSSNRFSIRKFGQGFIFDNGGCCLFAEDNKKDYYLALLNSCVFHYIFGTLNPTLNFQSGEVAKFPVIEVNEEVLSNISEITNECVAISKLEWDSFETSWDFIRHPLFYFNTTSIEEAFKLLARYKQSQFERLKVNEERLNSIFIDIYQLSDEVNPQIKDEDVTIKKIDYNFEMKAFISYAVGCMMGRYSLDEEGLIFAGGEFDSNKYQTFKADEDGILFISDTEYFEDDLLNRFVEFVKVVYGEETLEENLNFIADTECFKRKATENSRDCLRRYFLKGFMEDHLKVYQKRPIYWMFDSGKQNGFKALIYMHRYNEDMVARVRTDYLHPLQRKYEAELERLDHLINFDNISASETGKAKKLQEKLHKQLDECTQYDLLLAHVAHQRISLDLDDGVKVNYQKFQNIELTTDGSSKAKKGDLLYKVKM